MKFDFTPRFNRAYNKLPNETKTLFNNKIYQFADNWQHPSFRVKKVQGTDSVWEASLNMSIRFTLEFAKNSDGTQVCILLNIGDHNHCLRPPY